MLVRGCDLYKDCQQKFIDLLDENTREKTHDHEAGLGQVSS